MRTEQQITEEIVTLQADYHQRADGLTQAAVAAINVRLKMLREELVELLGAGARPCPACGQSPHAMKKRAAYEDKDGEHSDVYEVGCLKGCGRERAATPAKAVERWNALELKPVEV